MLGGVGKSFVDVKRDPVAEVGYLKEPSQKQEIQGALPAENLDQVAKSIRFHRITSIFLGVVGTILGGVACSCLLSNISASSMNARRDLLYFAVGGILAHEYIRVGLNMRNHANALSQSTQGSVKFSEDAQKAGEVGCQAKPGGFSLSEGTWVASMFV